MTILLSRRPVPSRRAAPAPEPARQAEPKPVRTVRAIRPGDAEEVAALLSSAFAVVAILSLWMVAQVVLLGDATQARDQHLLYGRLRSELSAATAPTGELDFENKPVEPGSPVALLSIPAIDLEQVVVDGTASGDLFAGPGHLRNTPMPGQAGVSVVMGRASTYGAPFRDLTKLHAGDTIEVQNAAAKVTYQVLGVRRAGDPVPSLGATATSGLLTLVTAEGSGRLGALRPGKAVYIDASTEEASPAGLVAGAVPAPELVMGRDTGALPVLVVLLAGLALLVGGITVARRHFAALLVWVIAAPMAIGLAWAVTDQVMRLLPNLM